MKKSVAVWMLMLAMLLSLFAPAAFAEDEPAWSAAYREFILNKGFASSGQGFGYEAVGGMPVYEFVKFGLYDLGSDGVPELIAYRGSNSHSAAGKYVYAFEEGEVRCLGEFGAYEGDVLYAPGSAYSGLFNQWMQMGCGDARYITYEDGQFEQTVVYKFEPKGTGPAPDYEPFFEYEQETDDDALNLTAHSLFKAYDDAGYQQQPFKSNFPYVLPTPTLFEIEAMGWEAFVEEYETRNDALSSGPKYSVDRIDHSFVLPGETRDFESVNYYDCVVIERPDTAAVQKINAKLRNAAEQFLSENQANTDFDWESGSPANAFFASYSENQSVSLTDDVISVCNLRYHFSPGDGGAFYYDCFNYDVQTGEAIPLNAYLGLSEEETKTMVQNAVVSAGYQGGSDYFQNTAVKDYKYYIDIAGDIHAVFDTYAIADGAASNVDVPLDFTPAPKIVSEPADTVESEDDAVSLSVHCYGPDLTYAWEYSDDDGAVWVPADCTRPVISIPKNEAEEGRLYRCGVLNSAGQTYSKPVKLTADMLRSAAASEPEGSAVEETTPAGRFPVWIVLAAGALALLALILLLLLRRHRKCDLPKEKTSAPVKETPASEQTHTLPGPKFCPRCGTPRTGGEAFCIKCGYSFRKQ